MTAEVIEQDYIDNKIAIDVPRYTEEQLKFIKKDLKRIPSLKWFWKNRHLLKEDMRLWESKAHLENGKTISARPGTYFNKGWNNFKGWDCSIGLDRVYIHWTGNITGACQAKLFGLDFYYNILEKNFKEKFNPTMKKTICPHNGCWCMPETHISKEKNIEIKPVLLKEYQLHKYSNL
jgi:hypothetical protein